MKISDFRTYLLNEKLSVNIDIYNISNKLYNLIKDTKKHKIKFNGDIFDTNIKINSINITIFDFNYAGSFEASDSKITEKGFDIQLNIDKNNITKNTLIHELNHALHFYMIGKDEFIKKTNFLKMHKLSLNFINDINIEKFFELVYYSEQSEINSYISESYYEIKDNILSNINLYFNGNISKEEFNKLFNYHYKNCNIYEISEELRLFNFNKLKKLNSNNLVIFFNVMNDKRKLIDKIRINNSKIKSFFYSIKNLLEDKYFSDHYYNKIDKSVTIKNLDIILKKYDNRFKTASKKIKNKLSKLYDIILDELIKEEKIK